MGSRRARPRASQARNRPEPMIFSARRPAPAASGERDLRRSDVVPTEPVAELPKAAEAAAERRPQRSARIVSVRDHADGRLDERERLLSRLLSSEGRGAITRAADQYLRAGFEFPAEQLVQLQLLEHLDETRVRAAIEALRGIIAGEPPLKRPIFEQRLKRLEDGADEESTRSAASELRRALRV